MKKEIFLLLFMCCNLSAVHEMTQKRTNSETNVEPEKLNKIIVDLGQKHNFEQSKLVKEFKSQIDSLVNEYYDKPISLASSESNDMVAILETIKTTVNLHKENNKKIHDIYSRFQDQFNKLSEHQEKELTALQARLSAASQ